MNERTRIWLKRAGIRAVKTMAQTAAATIGTAVAMNAVDWKMVVSASVLSGILSMLTSVAGIPEVDQELEDIENIVEIGELEEMDGDQI